MQLPRTEKPNFKLVNRSTTICDGIFQIRPIHRKIGKLKQQINIVLKKLVHMTFKATRIRQNMSKMAINSNQLIFCDDDDVFFVGFAGIAGLTFVNGF